MPALTLSDELEAWLTGEGDKTLGSLVRAFGDTSFAVLLVVLLGVPALPLPSGWVTHVFEVIAALIALELVAGRGEVWLPERWRRLELASPRRERFIAGLMRLIRRLERISRPRLRFLLRRRASDVAFGVLAVGFTAAAFVAPPFSGLDTLPALGVVVLALGMLLEDALVVIAGVVLGATGVALEVILGAAAVNGLASILQRRLRRLTARRSAGHRRSASWRNSIARG